MSCAGHQEREAGSSPPPSLEAMRLGANKSCCMGAPADLCVQEERPVENPHRPCPSSKCPVPTAVVVQHPKQGACNQGASPGMGLGS